MGIKLLSKFVASDWNRVNLDVNIHVVHGVADVTHGVADTIHGVAIMMFYVANIMHGVADMMAEWCVVGRPGSVSHIPF